MKLLLDHNLPRRFRQQMPGHEIKTAREMRWETLRNGLLLKAAADAGFSAFIAVDKKLEYEQNLKTLPLPVIVLDTVTNSLEGVKPFAPFILRLLVAPLNNCIYFINATGNIIELREPRRKSTHP